MHYELYRFYGINISFAKEGSKNIGKKLVIQEHNNSNRHKEALKKESNRLAIIKVTSNAINHINKYVESLMKIIYSMVQNNLPLNQFFQLIQLEHALESPNLISNLNSITYENLTSAKDLLSAIFSSIKKELWNELNETTNIGIMIDESINISI
ncbi:hypothetical protein C1645_817445 [Glomus cerebriforme]|uniref:C17orf113 probable zinc finger domain-containing protein n=1 Tax=Glomus cerebriforme TaxID=658196 RepID=A0A397TEF5_9GLOM|nr:hypothetical protein C1645_817445 [Glomus cerebriforme]